MKEKDFNAVFSNAQNKQESCAVSSPHFVAFKRSTRRLQEGVGTCAGEGHRHTWLLGEGRSDTFWKEEEVLLQKSLLG